MGRWMIAVALMAPAQALAQATSTEREGSSPAFWIAILAVFIALGATFAAKRKK